jgi:hypothetical protein
MTRNEFWYWKLWTWRCGACWKLHPILDGRPGRGMLMTIGGNGFGKYVAVAPDGFMSLGEYRGNPATVKATFKRLASKKYANENEAFQCAADAGLRGLLTCVRF